jgi:elongation factor P--beta-lysine ligase
MLQHLLIYWNKKDWNAEVERYIDERVLKALSNAPPCAAIAE